MAQRSGFFRPEMPAVILNQKLELVTRIFGPVTRELRTERFREDRIACPGSAFSNRLAPGIQENRQASSRQQMQRIKQGDDVICLPAATRAVE
jgi:hypothetical protein